MGTTTRLFFADPERGWRRVVWVEGYLVYHGAEAMLRYANQTIAVAHAHVEVDKHRVINLLRLEYSRWRFDDDGFVEQSFLRNEARKRLWPSNRDEILEQFALDQINIEAIHGALQIYSPQSRFSEGRALSLEGEEFYLLAVGL